MTIKDLYEAGQEVTGQVWTPERDWEGQDAFIIGGGASLKTFDFDFLKGKNTIGCNDAFRLGPEIVKICLFGDASFFNRAAMDLIKFPNPVVTNCPEISANANWLKRMIRLHRGFGKGKTLAWNYSTGAAALNFAVTVGANQIFLLGFDMGYRAGLTHWHEHNGKPTLPENFERFIKGFEVVKQSLAEYPDVKVYNVTDDGSSNLNCFEKINYSTMKGLTRELNRFNATPESGMVETAHA